MHAISELFDPAVVEHPYPFYADLRRHGQVHRVPGTNFSLVSTWDAVQEATARVDDFSSNLTAALVHQGDATTVFDMDTFGSSGHVLVTADDPYHSNERKQVLPGLVAKLFGLPDSDVPRLVEWGYGSTELLGGVLAEGLPKAVDAAIQLAGYLHGAFEAARSDPDDDLLGDLAATVNAGDVEPHVAVLMLVQLVGAGGESTAGLIGTAARLLATNPETQDAVRADPTMIPELLEETLRLESPFRGHHRHVVADTVLARTCPLARTCCCSGDRPTATKPRSPSRTGFDSTGHRHGVIWP
ncbi:MAG: putative cytochrome monooxygenase, partial [Mycobacterium sp.]|nr:putative cytochrome monooxygenase [Mycobacterium sp.]